MNTVARRFERKLAPRKRVSKWLDVRAKKRWAEAKKKEKLTQ